MACRSSVNQGRCHPLRELQVKARAELLAGALECDGRPEPLFTLKSGILIRFPRVMRTPAIAVGPPQFLYGSDQVRKVVLHNVAPGKINGALVTLLALGSAADLISS